MADDDDLPLVQALQKGEESALGKIMARHKTNLFRFIFRYVRNEADAVDLTQETFIRAYFHIRSFQPKARFITWLYTIARHLCQDHLGSRAYRNRMRTLSLHADQEDKPMELPAKALSPHERAQHVENAQALWAAIDQLPSPLKTVLILTALEGLPHKEAALRLGITPKTVETRVYRARKRLEKILRIATSVAKEEDTLHEQPISYYSE